MFNILDFIDSKEIREYNCTTKFTPIEQAVLIYHSERTTVDEEMSEDKIYENLNKKLEEIKAFEEKVKAVM
mgnify:CR=1 FL=1